MKTIKSSEDKTEIVYTSEIEHDNIKSLLSEAIKNDTSLYGADFSDIDLSGASFCGSDLSFVDFSGSNLRGADFSGTCLHGVDFRDADLTNADFSSADLRGADLRGANLRNIRLNWAIGNLNEIRSLQLDRYDVCFTSELLAIGCEQHSIERWKSFTYDDIKSMDRKANEWWANWKGLIFQSIYMSFNK